LLNGFLGCGLLRGSMKTKSVTVGQNWYQELLTEKFTGHLKHFSELLLKENRFKTYRAELIHKLTKGINREREGKYKPLTEKVVALMVNRNPFLAGKKNDGELSALIKECEEKGNYKKFWWAIKNHQINSVMNIIKQIKEGEWILTHSWYEDDFGFKRNSFELSRIREDGMKEIIPFFAPPRVENYDRNSTFEGDNVAPFKTFEYSEMLNKEVEKLTPK
jgi:hypothetical protein